MARLFTCGFEENSTTTTMWSLVVGAPTIEATTTHSGAYRGATAAAAGNSYFSRSLSAVATTALYARFYFMADDATPSALTYIMRWLSNLSVAGDAIQLGTDGKLVLLNEVAATSQAGTVTLSNNTWYRIEHKVLMSDTVGDNTVRLYDDFNALLETISLGSANEDTLPTNLTTFRLGKTASTSIFSYDDVAINDESGATNLTWPGIGKTAFYVPSSDVANAWNDAGTGFADIDDLPGAINDADYKEEATAALVDQFGITNPGTAIPADATITLVDVYGRVGSTQTGNTRMRFKLWDEAATLTNGPSCQANVNGWKIVSTAEHLVYQATGKTKANLDSFNIGMETITDATARRVSALWANVEWTEIAFTAALAVPAIQDSCEMIGMRNV